jgi:hypothetical protein
VRDIRKARRDPGERSEHHPGAAKPCQARGRRQANPGLAAARGRVSQRGGATDR